MKIALLSMLFIMVAASSNPLARQTSHLKQPTNNGTVDTSNAAILVFEGFVFGFLGDSADAIENCTLAS